jgi:hypothetical protein
MCRASAVLLIGGSFLLTACAHELILRRNYTATISSRQDSSSSELRVTVVPTVSYADEFIAVRQGASLLSASREEHCTPLVLTITNPTSNIVTLDWDHSVFVDSTGNSYKLLYPGSTRLPPTVEAIRKPPTPVIAPNAQLVVPVLPESPEPWSENRAFFLPRSQSEASTLRILLATSGTERAHSEVKLLVKLSDSSEQRDGSAWPKHGDPCIPVLGCNAGQECRDGTCLQPGLAPPTPPRRTGVKRLLESCADDADCLPGLECDLTFKLCKRAEKWPRA